MNHTPKPIIGKVNISTKPVNPSSGRKGGGKPPNGKATERQTIQAIQSYYGKKCRVDRLPDSLDVGRYEDRRPCDMFVSLGRNVESTQNTLWYIECKETGQDRKNLQFSVLKDGQWKAINFTIENQIPYFVVFQHLKTRTIYLIPATVIKEFLSRGKKSMNEDDLLPYIWTIQGKLYDNFCT